MLKPGFRGLAIAAVGALCIASFAAIGLAQTTEPKSPKATKETEARDVKRGEGIVATNCATCHAIGRQGASTDRNAPPFRDLHKRYPVETLAESLAEGITTGHAAMPEFKFDAKQVDEILDYLKTLEAPG